MLWNEFSDAELTIPELTIYQDGDSWHCIRACVVSQETKEINTPCFTYSSLLRDEGFHKSEKKDYTVAISECIDAKARWNVFIESALSAIREKKLKKLVAARTLQLTAHPAFPLASILHVMHENNPMACTFAFGKHSTCFLGATPETLFSAQKGFFHTMALAGSAPRGKTPDEDQQLGLELLNCDKERAEHEHVARTVKNTLDALCKRVQADSGPSLHRLPKVQHLITRFEGELKPDKTILHVLEQLHPTPAVGGLPSEKAMEFLRCHEGLDRGWYAGPVGWLNMDGDGEFMVALRSGLVDRTHATLFAGCGIVDGSNADKEYRETQIKLETMLDAMLPLDDAPSSLPNQQNQ